MSLEIFPTYPKIRAEQLSAVDWTQVVPLMDLINTKLNALLGNANILSAALSFSNLDPAIANAIGTAGSASRNAVRNAIDAPFLDPLIASNVNTPESQTRSAINALISASSMPYLGEFLLGAANWNDLTSTGIWRFVPGGTGGLNIPPIVPISGILLVVRSVSGVSQIVITDDNQIATRQFSASSWSAWRAVLNRTVQLNLESNTTLSTTETSLISITLNSETLGVATARGWRATLRVTGRIGITSSHLAPQVVYGAIVLGSVRQSVVTYPLSAGTEAIFEVNRLLTDILIDRGITLSLRAWVNSHTAIASTGVQGVATSLRIEY